MPRLLLLLVATTLLEIGGCGFASYFLPVRVSPCSIAYLPDHFTFREVEVRGRLLYLGKLDQAWLRSDCRAPWSGSPAEGFLRIALDPAGEGHPLWRLLPGEDTRVLEPMRRAAVATGFAGAEVIARGRVLPYQENCFGVPPVVLAHQLTLLSEPVAVAGFPPL